MFTNSVSDYSSVEELLSDMGMSFDFDLLGIASYILLALGLYAIAKRRGISKPWLAWIPLGNIWLLGFNITIIALAVVATILAVVAMVGVFSSGIDMMTEELTASDASALMGSVAPLLIAVVVLLVMCGFAIAAAVLEYIAYHDLFASCNPANKTLFTVLGIVLSFFGLSIVMSLFVFLCRNKDEGMPPRRDQMPEVEIPGWQPTQPQTEPWENNPVETPAWQPTQPPVEPWENNPEE